MIDPHKAWQNDDGGWPQFDSDRRSDLWATTYGVALLHTVSTGVEPCFEAHRKHTDPIVKGGIDFLKKEWRKSRWKYAKASSPHNGIQIFHELHDCLKTRDHDFLIELHQWVLQWLTPSGTLGPSYIEACDSVTVPSANARIAYALFQYGDPDRKWEACFEAAMRTFNAGVNSADAAFLLHMAQHYSQYFRHSAPAVRSIAAL